MSIPSECVPVRLRWWEIENLNNKKPLISEINGKVEGSIELEFKTKLGIEQIGYL